MTLEEEIRSVALLSGTFTLRSGADADVYFDKYQFESRPRLLRAIAQAMVPLVPTEVEVLAGLELGGIPLVTLLSQLTDLPAAFIRKEPKKYGTCRYAEGVSLVGRQVALVEDVATSGGALVDAISKLRADGVTPSIAICVVDREAGARERLLREGVPLVSLFTLSQIRGDA